jgi:hypothetical protein
MSTALVQIVIGDKKSQPMPHNRALLLLDGMAKRTANKATLVPYTPPSEVAARSATPRVSQYEGWSSGRTAAEAAALQAQVRARFQPSRLDPSLRGLG